MSPSASVAAITDPTATPAAEFSGTRRVTRSAPNVGALLPVTHGPDSDQAEVPSSLRARTCTAYAVFASSDPISAAVPVWSRISVHTKSLLA